MFLNKLSDNEKEMFLDMAVYVSKANGLVEETEKNLISQYCHEMCIETYNAENIHNLEEIYNVFSNSSNESKRIAVLELLGLGYSDGNIDELENSVIVDFARSIGVPEDIFNRLNRDIEEYCTVISIIQGHISSTEENS